MDEDFNEIKDIFKILEGLFNNADIESVLDNLLNSSNYIKKDARVLNLIDKIIKENPKRQNDYKKNRQMPTQTKSKQYIQQYPLYTITERNNFYIISMALGPSNYQIDAICEDDVIEINGICHESKTYIYTKINIINHTYPMPYKQRIEYSNEANMYYLTLIFEKKTE